MIIHEIIMFIIFYFLYLYKHNNIYIFKNINYNLAIFFSYNICVKKLNLYTKFISILLICSNVYYNF